MQKDTNNTNQIQNDVFVLVQLKPSENCTINPKITFNFKVKSNLTISKILKVLISQLQLKPDSSLYLYRNRKILKPLNRVSTLTNENNNLQVVEIEYTDIYSFGKQMSFVQFNFELVIQDKIISFKWK